jgi:hypothetical protein
MQSTIRPLLAALLAAACGTAFGQAAAPNPTRGELLYAAHCKGCHTTQMHWRDQKIATDWASLKEQVRRWQQRETLGWSEDDITEVARHLNDTIYRHPRSATTVGRATPPAPVRVAGVPAGPR